MAVKSVSIRIEEEMLAKLGFVADYEGRSVNSHVLVLIRENIKKFEAEHGAIEGTIRGGSAVPFALIPREPDSGQRLQAPDPMLFQRFHQYCLSGIQGIQF